MTVQTYSIRDLCTGYCYCKNNQYLQELFALPRQQWELDMTTHTMPDSATAWYLRR